MGRRSQGQRRNRNLHLIDLQRVDDQQSLSRIQSRRRTPLLRLVTEGPRFARYWSRPSHGLAIIVLVPKS